ncbi:hypothetical protein TNCV_1530291 [Trichonephila clavipes]|uniref:Uncharacterized protein n=1 Tax=Trichonephila clavipes TaxID=2585209 RepID=A0A8X6RAR6_TRICX|nr:hypothetical protein TNCV_1530291 [Trichonephila clavipes]
MPTTPTERAGLTPRNRKAEVRCVNYPSGRGSRDRIRNYVGEIFERPYPNCLFGDFPERCDKESLET